MIYQKDFNEQGIKISLLNPVPENYTNKIVERTRGVLKYKLDKIQSTLV